MSNNHKNFFIAIAIFAVIFLIIFNNSKKTNDSNRLVPKIIFPFFPTQKEPQTAVMQALLIGKLKLDGKCLRVNENLIVWPYGYFLKMERDTIKIFNEKSELAAIVGDTVKLGGEQIGSSESKIGKLPLYQNQDCKGSLWIVGEVYNKD